jgi:2-haloacid dehalogenase
MSVADVRALVFDVFGTVVDYRSTIIREGQQLNAARGLSVDWAAFSDTWRGRYAPSMDRVRKGELPWTNLDALHRMVLNDLLVEFNISGLTEEETDHLNRVWHRLGPWPDAVAGLTRLKTKYVIATLSNGNVALLLNMAKYGGLPWDTILSAELVRAYKPDPRTYHMAADLLGLRREQVALVAAHPGDLRAAQAAGLRAIYVPRPDEFGPDRRPEQAPASEFDLLATDFLNLADRLGV